MKEIRKKILKSSFGTSCLAFFIASYVRFIGYTTRWKVANAEVLRSYVGKPVIVALWHGRLLMIPHHSPRAKANALISNQGDGELIAKVQKYFGYGTIRGSTSRGGVAAIREIIKAAEKGEALIITPDGPRGPARKVSGNVVELSKKLALPIIPVTYSCTKHRLAKSWDSFMLPKPFGRGVFLVGDPIPPEKAESLEEELNKLTDVADAYIKNIQAGVEDI